VGSRDHYEGLIGGNDFSRILHSATQLATQSRTHGYMVGPGDNGSEEEGEEGDEGEDDSEEGADPQHPVVEEADFDHGQQRWEEKAELRDGEHFDSAFYNGGASCVVGDNIMLSILMLCLFTLL